MQVRSSNWANSKVQKRHYTPVRLFDERVGELMQTDAGRLEFRYDPDWVDGGAQSLSISLPVRNEVFDHRAAEPFFGGLLPEGDVRERIVRYFGVSLHNDFALLEKIGGECAGAVTLAPASSSAPAADVASERIGIHATPLSEDQLTEFLADLPRRPMFAGGERRLSLAGAQDKAAVVLVDGKIALPVGSEPTTHILKTPIRGFDGTVANELLCLRTAARLGLRVATAERRAMASGDEFLLVTRFDRALDATGQVQRIHQEDLCQALCIPTRLKYQSEGGPSLPDCFNLLTRSSRHPAVDRLALLRATAFTVLVGNADAHAKNFSLLYEPDGLRLAPLYDLLSTLVYEDLSPRYAMKIGSRAAFDEIRGRHWTALAEAAGLAPAQVRREVLAMAKNLPTALSEEAASEAFADLEPAARAILDRVIETSADRAALTEVRVREG